MKKFNVLSLFDGISCAQIALNRAGIIYDNYFASEIDKYAIKVTQHNYPKTRQLGDITKWREWNLPEIDLICAGSPCQGFSFAGKQLNFEDERSKLFFVFVEILEEIKKTNQNVLFLLENVRMKKESSDVITQILKVEPIEINSALLSAQNRRRLYWTNIQNVTTPTDQKINWGDIREFEVDHKFYYSKAALKWLDLEGQRKGKKISIWGNDQKCQMIEASHYKLYSSQRFFGIEDVEGLRYITPLECERAQTIPDNFTSQISDTQRYKSIGNGWTVDVIAHILKNIHGRSNHP